MRFIPYNKLSKKEKRKIDSLRRKNWGDIDCSTKILPDVKKERIKQQCRHQRVTDVCE